jgi:hypothetical protein
MNEIRVEYGGQLRDNRRTRYRNIRALRATHLKNESLRKEQFNLLSSVS